jgi:hypothetical protein
MYLMSNLLENLGIKYVFFSSLPWKNSTSIKIILESFEEEIRELKNQIFYRQESVMIH